MVYEHIPAFEHLDNEVYIYTFGHTICDEKQDNDDENRDNGSHLMSCHECPLVTRLLYCSINPKCFIIELEYHFFTVVNHTYKKNGSVCIETRKKSQEKCYSS